MQKFSDQTYRNSAGRRTIFYVLIASVLCLFVTQSVYADIYDNEPLIITTDQQDHKFRVELAITPDKRAVGLMNREAMPKDAGMLFCFEKVSPVMMWMKNTILPLDMIFIRSDGTISSIVENTTPFSTNIIPSDEPVLFVLELNAGTVAELSIKNENRVQHSSILSCAQRTNAVNGPSLQ